MPFNSFNSIAKLPKKTGGVSVTANWVAVGGGAIAKSTDGNTWTPAATNGGITSGYGVAYGKDNLGGNLWVAVGGGGLIAKSTDGNTWTPAATVSGVSGKGGITLNGFGVAYGKDNLGAGLWVAVGRGGLIAKSTDGNVWTPADGPTTYKGGIESWGYGVAYGKDNLGAGLWVAVGGVGLIAKSTDGNVWTPAASKGGITLNGRGVAYGKDASGVGLWVAVGEGGLIAKSTNGNTWTPAASTGGLTTFGYGVAYGKDASGVGLWVAVGGGGVIAKSTDGNVWTPAATSPDGSKGGLTYYGRGVAYGKDNLGGNLWVAVGDGGLIAKSTDGNVWTPAASTGGVSGSGYGAAFKRILYDGVDF